METAADRGSWGSRIGFVLAAAGSAVGLGNIWRFPYATGENGGGWFVLIYLVCVALIGVPIMMAEIMIGRAARKQPVAAFHALQGGHTAWAGVGWLGVIAGFVILSYYVVIAGWAMDFTLKSIANVTEPVHKQAEITAMTHRATADLDEMRLALTRRMAEREGANRIAEIRLQARPSALRDYETYKVAIKEAGAIDPVAINAVREVWEQVDPDLQQTAEVVQTINLRLTADQRQSYEAIRTKLFEKEGFADGVQSVESLLPEFERAKLDAYWSATAYMNELPPEEIRNRSEDMVRRSVIREHVAGAFNSLAGDGWTTLFWTALFMLATIVIVAGGISKGIERACFVLMPTLFVLILILVVYGMFTRGFDDALRFVFRPDASKLTPSGALGAMGQAFFSLSLGMGAMITYGSYQKTKENLGGEAVTIAGLDTAVALLACLMIFPIVFTFDQEPASGPGLVFMTMPLAFTEIGQGGMIIGAVFFGLLVFAAVTSSISLLEVVASYFIDERGWTRRMAVWTLGTLIFLFAIPSAFAGDPDFAMGGWMGSYGEGFDFLTVMDSMASNWMLPLGGFFIAIYAGWVMPRRLRESEVATMSGGLAALWLILARFVAPAMVLLILLQSIELINFDELLYDLFH